MPQKPTFTPPNGAFSLPEMISGGLNDAFGLPNGTSGGTKIALGGPGTISGGTNVSFGGMSGTPGGLMARTWTACLGLRVAISLAACFGCLQTANAQNLIAFDQFSPVNPGNQAIALYPQNAPASLIVGGDGTTSSYLPNNLAAGNQGAPFSFANTSRDLEGVPCRWLSGYYQCGSPNVDHGLLSIGQNGLITLRATADTRSPVLDEAFALAYLYSDSNSEAVFAAFGDYQNQSTMVTINFGTGVQSSRTLPYYVFGACGLGDLNGDGHVHILVSDENGRVRQLDLGVAANDAPLEVMQRSTSGLSGLEDMAFDGTRLYAVNGDRVGSAPFTPVCSRPAIINEPTSANVCYEDSPTFTVAPPPELVNLTYQWQVREPSPGAAWTNLNENGGLIRGNVLINFPEGVRSPNLTLPYVACAVGGGACEVRCLVSNLCGTTESVAALLTVHDPSHPTCNPPACDSIDFNNDTSLFDPQDIEAFLSVYSEGPCIPEGTPGGCNDIDFNNDTSLFDPCDINSFLLMYSEGPCTPCGA